MARCGFCNTQVEDVEKHDCARKPNQSVIYSEGETPAEAYQPIKRLNTQYIGTLPDGYEWRFILGDPLRIVGFNQTNGIKLFRVEELKLVEDEKGFETT